MVVPTLQQLAALQQVVLGTVLLWAAAGKLFTRSGPAVAGHSALARLLGPGRARTAYRLVGGAELVIAGGLLLPPVARIEAVAATVLAAGFLAYLGYARRAAPDSSCGCLGTRSAPVRGRSLLRAAALLVAGLAAIPAALTWPDAVAGSPAPAAAVVLGELAVLVALSPELDHRWLVPLRRLRLRISHPLASRPAAEPLESTLHRLYASDAYRSIARQLRSDVQDSWDEAGWRIVSFGARHMDRPATALFAVPTTRPGPDLIRVAVVDDAGQQELLLRESTVE